MNKQIFVKLRKKVPRYIWIEIKQRKMGGSHAKFLAIPISAQFSYHFLYYFTVIEIQFKRDTF